jgi:hypothetical protein
VMQVAGTPGDDPGAFEVVGESGEECDCVIEFGANRGRSFR